MRVRLQESGQIISLPDVHGHRLIADGLAVVLPEVEESQPHPGNYRPRVQINDGQDSKRRPALYALRDRISKQGVPIKAADVIALEIYQLQERVESLENQKFPPHLKNVETRAVNMSREGTGTVR